MTELSISARHRYLDDGYVVVPDVIDHARIDAVLHDIDRIVKAQLGCHRLHIYHSADLHAIRSNLEILHHHDQQLYLSTLRVLNKLKSLYDLFLDDGISTICRQLGVELPMLHTLPIFHVMSHSLVIDKGYHGFASHQDWHGVQTSLNTIVVWFPFHDVDRQRFPLEVLPRSHRGGLREPARGHTEPTAEVSPVVDGSFVPLEIRKGGAAFMSCFTLHRTGVTQTDALRLAASWRYEDAAEPTWVARQFPFAETRAVSSTLLFPGFPNTEVMRGLIES